MRLSEITDDNKLWLVMTDTIIDFNEQYAVISGITDLFFQMKRKRNLTKMLTIGNIPCIEFSMNEFKKISFPTDNDPDIIQILNDISRIESGLIELQKKITQFCA